MIIKFSPVRVDKKLEITKNGDTLTINGIPYDFTQLPEGATLPNEAIGCEWIVSDVHRVNGQIELTILLPHGADASESARFPTPINMTTDGQVVLPV